MKKQRLRFTGIRPLIMQSVCQMDLSTAAAEKRYNLNAQIKAARKKPDNFNELLKLQQESFWVDWQASSYFYEDEKGAVVFYIPAEAIVKTLEAGAANAKARREIVTGCIVEEDRVPVTGIPKHKTLRAYFEDPVFSMRTSIRVPPRTGARNLTTKPMMPTGWVLEFDVTITSDEVAPERVIKAAQQAGLTCGLGGWRPRFGRFEVTVL